MFLITGTDPAYVNALRRTIIDEVPTLAIEDVEFKKNSSALYDEVIAHRLGLIPLKTDLAYQVPATEEEKESLKCSVKLSLTTKAAGIVTADKLKSADPNVVPVHEQMPIVKLLPGQQLQFDALAVMGRGKEHAKWSPAHVSYQGVPKLSINNSKISDADDFVKNSPAPIFDAKGGKVSVNEDALLSHAQAAEALSDYSEAITVSRSDKDFLFTVEPFGQLSAKDIMTTALDILTQKMEAFSNAL